MILPEFNFNRLLPQIKPDGSTYFPTIAIVGPSFSGKSMNVLRMIIFYIARGVVTPENIYLFKETDDKYPDHLVHNKFRWNEEKLQEIIVEREEMTRQGDPTVSLVILDDVTEHKRRARESSAIARLIYAGRHSRIITILSYHDFTFINKNPRTSIDFFMFPKINSVDIIEWIKRYDLKHSRRELETMFAANASYPRKNIYKTIVLDKSADPDESMWSVITG